MKAGKKKRALLELHRDTSRVGKLNAIAISDNSAEMHMVDTHYMKLIPKKATRINQRFR